MDLNKTYPGDVRESIKVVPDNFINTIVTSPPYYALRLYMPNAVVPKESAPDDILVTLDDLKIECKLVYFINKTS